MKKIFLLLTLISTLLSSCSSDSVFDSNSDSETRAASTSRSGTGMAPSMYLTNYFKSESIAKIQRLKIVDTAEASYFAAQQFDGGYTGLQTTSDMSLGVANIQIFSYWDLNTSSGLKAKHIYTSPGTTRARFGGEGDGAQTKNGYNWKLNTWYTTVTRAWKVGTDIYIACFIQNEASQEWLHTATLARPDSDPNKFLGVNTYSFLENWLGTNPSSDGRYKRKVYFKDAWNLGVNKQWEKPYAVYVSAARNGTIHQNSFNGNYDSNEGAYFLEHGGTVTPNASFGGTTALMISPSIESKNTQTKPNITIGEITNITVSKNAQGNTVVDWTIDSKKTPQFSTLIKVLDKAGTVVSEFNEIKPEKRSQIITNLVGGASYTLSLEMTDIFNQVSTKTLSFVANGTSSSTGITQVDSNLWYRIKSKKNGNYISIRNSSIEKLIQSSTAVTNSSDMERQWKFQQEGDYYIIVNRRTNKAIDIPGASQTNGTELIQYTTHKGLHQQWKIVSVGNSTFYIQSRLNTLPLIYSGNNSAANSSVSIYSNIRNSGDLTEDWILEPVK